MKRPRTPEELVKEKDRDKYSLYLSVSNMNEIKELARKSKGTSPSAIVDEAIRFYLDNVKEVKKT